MGKYVVIDLEMCKVSQQMKTSEYHWGSETIQIGAVLLDENYEIVDQFNTYVAPQNGQIDPFIQHLTGIDNKDIKDAPIMKEALNDFINWLPDEDVSAVSWSITDNKQICHEIEARHIKIDRLDALLNNWIDCQKTFAEKLETNRCYKLSEALVAADIDYKGQAHDGLTDAYNTALLFSKMQRSPKLELNHFYEYARQDECNHLQVTLGDFFTNVEFPLNLCG